MIRVENLTKRYGDFCAVDSISFTVERGEVVGFLGPNGAGKSTTMKCLTGYLHADGGRVEIGGHEVHPDDLETKRRVGYLPESTPLYRRMRVAAYLEFVGRVRGFGRGERRDAIARVVLDCGLDGYAGRRIGELSKGYRQRVGLAQALLADPDVLILDEPTSGLDPAEIARIHELIRALGKSKTILLSTHVLGEVQETCRRVVILAAGRIVADGTPLDLAADERAELRLTVRGAYGASGAPDAPGAPGAIGAVADDLRRVEGVASVRAIGVDDAGRAGFALVVDERHATAERVAKLVQERGLALVELRHELPSLEQVFLQKTEPA